MELGKMELGRWYVLTRGSRRYTRNVLFKPHQLVDSSTVHWYGGDDIFYEGESIELNGEYMDKTKFMNFNFRPATKEEIEQFMFSKIMRDIE